MKSHKVTTISKLNFYYILYNIESYFSLVHLKVIAYFQVCLTFKFFFFFYQFKFWLEFGPLVGRKNNIVYRVCTPSLIGGGSLTNTQNRVYSFLRQVHCNISRSTPSWDEVTGKISYGGCMVRSQMWPINIGLPYP